MRSSPSTDHTGSSSHPPAFTMPMDRLEAFSNGVFAFAITLLVLNFQVPRVPSGGLARALLDQWPSYLSYIVSFFVIGVMWINYYAVSRLIARVDRVMLMMNLIHLLGVTFLPYPTALLGAYIQSEQDARVAAVLYAGTATVIAIGFNGFLDYAVLHGFLWDFVGPARARALVLRYGIGLLAFSLGIVVAFFSAPLSLALFALVHVFYVIDQTGGRPGRPVEPTPIHAHRAPPRSAGGREDREENR